MLSLLTSLVLTQTYPVLQNATVVGNGGRPVTGLTSGEFDLIVAVNGLVDGGSPAFSLQVQESDPLMPQVVLDGGIGFTVGPIAASLQLAPIHAKLFGSSSVYVTWTVDGGSYFSGVDVALVNRAAVAAPSVEGIDGGRAVNVAIVSGGTGGGGGGSLPDAGLLVQFNGDGGVGAVAVMNQPATYPITRIGDGGNDSVVITGTITPVPVFFPGDGGNISTFITGGTVAATVTPPAVQGVQFVGDGGTGGVNILNQPTLSYIYGTPLPADTSSQTSGQSGITLCGTAGTIITVQANAKNQTICNQSSNPVCFGFTAGLSCPPAIDAGTTLGTTLQPQQCFTQTGSVQMYCVTQSVAMSSPDGGLSYLDDK